MILVNDKPVEWTEGMTVSDLLEKIENTALCAVIRLNGKLVSSPYFHNTEIPDRSEIHILPPVAGG